MIWLLNLIFIFLNCSSFQQKSPKPQTTIHFKEFSITLLDYEVEADEQARLLKNQKDLITVACIPGEVPEGRLIRFKANGMWKVQMQYSYETGIFVTADGVSCDLSYWKHFSAPLVNLKRNKDGAFIYPELKEKERTQFIPVNIDELKKEVKSNCGDDFYKLIKNNESVMQGASGVEIYRYGLKISATDQKTYKSISKKILFDIPMD